MLGFTNPRYTWFRLSSTHADQMASQRSLQSTYLLQDIVYAQKNDVIISAIMQEVRILL